MIDLTVKDILLEPALLVIEKLAGIAVHCAGSRGRADAVCEYRESGSELGLALGQLDHLVEITKLRAGGIQFGDAAIHVHQHGVEVVDELRSWNVHRIHVLAGRHPAPEYAIAHFRAVLADHHAAHIVLAHHVLIHAADAVGLHRLNGERQACRVVNAHPVLKSRSHVGPSVVAATVHPDHAELHQAKEISSTGNVGVGKPCVV